MLNLACMGFSMIDQDLINKCNWELETFDALSAKNQAELLSNYIKLIEQNAELHKANEKHKAQLKSLIECSDNNSGYEPSLSVFQREVDISKELLGIPL